MPPGYVPQVLSLRGSYRPDHRIVRSPPGGYRAGAPAAGQDDEPDIYRSPNAAAPAGPNARCAAVAFEQRRAAASARRGDAPGRSVAAVRNRMSSPPIPTVAACCRRRRSVSRSALRRLRRPSPSRLQRRRSAASAAAQAKARRQVPKPYRLQPPQARDQRRPSPPDPGRRQQTPRLAKPGTIRRQNKSAPGIPGRSTLRKNR